MNRIEMIEMIWFQRQGNLGSSGMFRARAHPRLQAIAPRKSQGVFRAAFSDEGVPSHCSFYNAYKLFIDKAYGNACGFEMILQFFPWMWPVHSGNAIV